MNVHPFLRAVVLLAVALAASGPAPRPAVPEILARIVREADVEANYLLNDRRAALFRERAAAATDPVERLIQRSLLAAELVRAGDTREGIAEAQTVLDEATARGVPAEAPVMRSLHELLAVGWLRVAEQENCLAHHDPDSCLMPLRAGGIHAAGEGARNAAASLEELLADAPGDLGHRWLLNLAHMALGDWPEGVPERWRIPPAVFGSEQDFPRFRDTATSHGVAAVGLAGGAVLEDLDGDGDLDLMTSSWGLEDPLAYYRNEGGGRFTDASAGAGLAGQIGGLNLVRGDYDGDGRPDVLVLRGGWLGFVSPGQGDHPNSLLRNLGGGRFEDVTLPSGLLSLHPTQTAAWADYDLDGDLDLFVGNESTAQDVHPCELFRNRGDGTFEDVAGALGAAHVGFVKGVAWGDVDDDGWPDLYLSRFGQENVLLRNVEGQRFEDVTARAGVAEPVLSFPTWFWDYDQDGHEDLLVASFSSYSESALGAVVADYLGLGEAEHSRLYRNRGDGSFEDVTGAAGLDAVLMAMGAGFGDLDGDGWLDAAFGTGQPALATLVPNRAFRNDAGRFRDVTTAGGFGHLQKGHAIAFGDVDGDGDQDVYAVMGGAYTGDVFPNALFENPGPARRWLKLRLVGERSNRFGVGARVTVSVRQPGGTRRLHRTVGATSSFGASPLGLEIGLGDAEAIESVEVRWPAPGRPRQLVREVALDSTLEIREAAAPGDTRPP